MNNKQFQRMAQAVFDRCTLVATTKGIDYTGEEDRLSDFKDMGAINDVNPSVIANIFGQKHHRAIDRYRKYGHLESESLEMRVVDAINYHLLELAALVEEGYTPNEEWLWRALNPNVHSSAGGTETVRIGERVIKVE